MLDKSIPYAGLFMRREKGSPIPEFTLPDGFKFSYYNEGDEVSWARIEASVLEFDSEFAALLYFKKNFVPYANELKRRCLFIENEDGNKVATATAWWSQVDDERRSWMHWVGVNPQFQGLGLGKSIVSRVTKLMRELDGDVDMYLKTQTWSYKAIGIYSTCGYELTDEKRLYKNIINSYKKALKILRLHAPDCLSPKGIEP